MSNPLAESPFRAGARKTGAEADPVCTQLPTHGEENRETGENPRIDGPSDFLVKEEVGDDSAHFRAISCIDASAAVRARLEMEVLALLDTLPPAYAVLRKRARHLVALSSTECLARQVEADELRARLAEGDARD